MTGEGHRRLKQLMHRGTEFLGCDVAVVLGLPAAYALHRLALPGRAAVRAALLVPFVLPTVVVGVAFRRLLGEGGRMVVPVAGTMMLVVRRGDDVTISRHGSYRFVPLV